MTTRGLPYLHPSIRRRIRLRGADEALRALCVILAIKPLLDLSWFVRVPLGPIVVSPLHAAGIIAAVLILITRPRLPKHLPWSVRFFQIFLAVHALALIANSLDVERGSSPASYADYSLRVAVSYVFFVGSYSIFRRATDSAIKKAADAAIVGLSLAVAANSAAIAMGFGGAKGGSFRAIDLARNRGLYYDPGALAAVASFCLIFNVYCLLTRQTTKRRRWTHWSVCVASSVLLILSVSRSFLILSAIALAWLFLRSKNRSATALLLVGVLAMVVSFVADTETIGDRFSRDIQIVGDGAAGLAFSGRGGSVEDMARFGNNRGARWENAVRDVPELPAGTLLFGGRKVSVAHSDFFDMVHRLGLVGLFLYVCLIVSLWTALAARDRRSGRSLDSFVPLARVLLFCYLLYSIPFRPLLDTTTSWYLWVFAGAALSRGQNLRISRRSPGKKRSPRSIGRRRTHV